MWDLIVSVPDHCLSFTLRILDTEANNSMIGITNCTMLHS